MLRTLARVLSVVCLVGGLITSPAQAPAASGDYDGDGLLDVWETQGYDADGDGVVDVDLPGMGASPLKKDLFVEMDYMPGLLPAENELDRIVEVFATLPVQNPDGTRGIALHLDAGPARSAKYNLGGGNEVPHRNLDRGVSDVSTLRATESAAARNRIFHYMVWGDSYGTGSSSGQAWQPGKEFLVTVGPKYWNQNNPAVRIGTFVHELGHNLGLSHGGTDGVNYKPNYLSVMNYRYQLSGVPRMNGLPHFGYSVRTMPSLMEGSLMETSGLGSRATGWQMRYQSGSGQYTVHARGPIDYDRDGVISPTAISRDLNGNGTLETLTGPNDLERVRFQAGVGGTAFRSMPVPVSNELTADEARRQGFIP